MNKFNRKQIILTIMITAMVTLLAACNNPINTEIITTESGETFTVEIENAGGSLHHQHNNFKYYWNGELVAELKGRDSPYVDTILENEEMIVVLLKGTYSDSRTDLEAVVYRYKASGGYIRLTYDDAKSESLRPILYSVIKKYGLDPYEGAGKYAEALIKIGDETTIEMIKRIMNGKFSDLDARHSMDNYHKKSTIYYAKELMEKYPDKFDGYVPSNSDIEASD